MKKLKLAFDIDGVLCSNRYGDYLNAEPYWDMIRLVNELHDNGCYIIIHTARGYGKYNGKIGLINKKWYAATQKQLDSWGLKYDELHLGKILADVFVDDRGYRVRADGSSVESLKKFLNGVIEPENEKA